MNTLHPLQSEEVPPLKLGGEADQHPGLIENPVGIDLVLDSLVKFLILLLDAPLDNQTLLNGSTEPLKETADALILGYPFFGLDPDLTNSEIEFGLDDAYSLIDLLEKNPNGFSIDDNTEFELKATAKAIIEELEDGE
jgi:hypothetical protein